MQTMTKGAPDGAPTLPACLMIGGQAVTVVAAKGHRTKINDPLFRLVELIPEAIFEDGVPLVAACAQVSLPGGPSVLAAVWVKIGAAADVELGTDLAAVLTGRA